MTSSRLRMRQGDRLPLFTATVEDDDGRAVNLTNARVWMNLHTVDGSPVFGENVYGFPIEADGSYQPEMLIVAAGQGIIAYDWSIEESTTLAPVVYEVGAYAVWPGGDSLTTPTDRTTQLVVSTGLTGPPGPPGPPGPAGPQGVAGPAGEEGEVWWSGAADPTAGFAADVGDWYLNVTTGDVFELVSLGSWLLRANIMGPAGPAGAAGAAGAAGPAGPGVAAGGTTGQLLTKTSATDYATGWTDPATAIAGLAAPIRYTFNAQTGTSYTIALSDENKMVTLNNAGAIALTVPTNATVAIPVGYRTDVAQLGAGQVTVGGAGITFVASPTLKLRAAGSAVSLIKFATDSWLVTGDLASS